MKLLLKLLLIITILLSADLSSQNHGTDQEICRIEVKPPQRTSDNDSAYLLQIVVYILDGWHINEHRPTNEFTVPTKLSMVSTDQYQLGEITYPNPDIIHLPNEETPTKVYRDSVILSVPISVKDSDPILTSIINGKLRYQACNDEICLPPAILTFTDTLKFQ